MESMPVNWEALDALVIGFAKSENLIEDSAVSSHSPPPSPSSSSSYHSRLLIRQIRRSLEVGDIDAAMDLLRARAPSLLDDHRLLFRLQKQKFIELLRRGTAEDRGSAINCLRTALAPCALDAYPEAYEEFKHVLLAFVFDKDDKSSPVANEWSEKRRFDIAGSISSVLRAHLQAYDPMLSMTLRYLISVHKGFCLRQGLLSPISDLTERLLLEERDPAATPQESLYEVPPFDEVDIQALAHAVELTRQGAVDSLRFAKGDLFQAFQNELCRMRLDVSVLDELVREYCVYRGIVDSGLAFPSAPGMQIMSGSLKVNQPEQGCCSSINCSLEVECTTSNSDGEISMSNAHMDGSPEICADVLSMQGMDAEERHPCETRNNHEDCSTSGTHQLASSKVLQRNRNQGLGERSKRKRWRGRQEEFDLIPEVLTGISKQELSTTAVASTIMLKEQKVSQSHFPMDVISNREDKFEIVLAMKELASRGMAAEVVEEVNAMDPNFFLQNPLLLFKLKQVEFLKLVGSGDHSTALRVARSHLGPLAASDPALLKPLKETLLALLRPNEDALGAGLPLNAIATSLQVAIGRRLGIEEPQIMKIMRATLYTHNGWFKLQMCKDPFEGLLRIGSLKDVSSPLLTDAATKSNADTCTHGSSQVTISSSSRMQEDGSSPTQVSSSEVICDENAILKVMEFLALPRADAIHLLAQYNGNAETVIQQIFA
ncbi:Glucose-induced degradation protein [Actinidia chinensis var. chinensis]|uniref:Glucose-induced degradation protein n=1 Tax=Actinidia chinensis var. chinensis TaxID=1590841 RepID=A0A2R6R5K6_ACTCC|nr:Glucose-induced degradation protein [Actinidia chinensis var. chinensis]